MKKTFNGFTVLGFFLLVVGIDHIVLQMSSVQSVYLLGVLSFRC
ncbi:unnamed protein product [Brassica oleracea]